LQQAIKGAIMVTKTIKAIHKWWVFEVALANLPFFWLLTFPLSASLDGYLPPQYLYWHIVWKTLCRTMTIAYPAVFFILACLCITLPYSFATIDETILLLTILLLLCWSLFAYLTMIFWLWYKNKCHKMKTPKDKRLTRFIMKKMLKSSPYYLAIHVFFILLTNCLSVILLRTEPLFVVLLLAMNLVFIFIFYGAYYCWIRQATYPLRNKMFRM
jgi:hypothetical protein